MRLSDQLQLALSESLQKDDVVVRWRKGSSLTVWIFRLTGQGPVLMGYGNAFRNWRKDALHRDIFTMVDLDASSKGYEQLVFDTSMEVTYPVMFKRLRDDGPKKVQRPTGDLYRSAITMNSWNKKIGKKSGITLTPGKKPFLSSGQDKTKPMDIKR